MTAKQPTKKNHGSTVCAAVPADRASPAPDDANRWTQTTFQTPDSTYRSVPFCSLNDELDAAELDRQLRGFKEGGEHMAVGPATFRANADWPNREPGEANWYDARLTGKARVWRDDYYMIPFGLLQPPVLLEAGG